MGYPVEPNQGGVTNRFENVFGVIHTAKVQFPRNSVSRKVLGLSRLLPSFNGANRCNFCNDI